MSCKGLVDSVPDCAGGLQLNQLPPEEREEALKSLMGHQCGADCSHDHPHHNEEPHVHGPNCSHDGHHVSGSANSPEAADETMEPHSASKPS